MEDVRLKWSDLHQIFKEVREELKDCPPWMADHLDRLRKAQKRNR